MSGIITDPVPEKKQAKKKMHVLSIHVVNHAGVLSRIAGLFSRRMYNIDSLSVGETEDPKISRMTIVTHADENTFHQIQNQLAKLEDVKHICELHKDQAVLREHVLIKVNNKDTTAIMQICQIFRANVVDVSKKLLTLELTGGPSKINAFIDLMEQFEIEGLVRTGLTGLKRGSTTEAEEAARENN